MKSINQSPFLSSVSKRTDFHKMCLKRFVLRIGFPVQGFTEYYILAASPITVSFLLKVKNLLHSLVRKISDLLRFDCKIIRFRKISHLLHSLVRKISDLLSVIFYFPCLSLTVLHEFFHPFLIIIP